MKKTLLVGLDAACWDYLDPVIQDGRAPTLRQLMKAGTWGSLESTLPAQTPTAWPSIVTGKNPGKHGVFDFNFRRPGTYEFFPTNARIRMGTPFWEHLNREGIRVGMVNIPFCHPPEPLDGFVLCGFGAPMSAADLAYPASVLDVLAERFGEYKPDIERERIKQADLPEIFAMKRHHQQCHVQMATALSEEYHVDVLAINLMLLDHANHIMPQMAQVEQAIVDTDADIRYLIDEFQPDNIMLLSDHGSRRVTGDFLLNVWLLDHGYSTLAQRSPLERAAEVNWVLNHWTHKRVRWNGLQQKVLRRLIKDTVLRLPDPLSSPIWHSVQKEVPFAREHVNMSEQPDYERTLTFPLGKTSGLLYFNMSGREPTGVLPQEERQAFAAELIDKLGQLEDPDTGEPIIDNAYLCETIYSGSATAYAPDLILDCYSSPWSVATSARRNYTSSQTYSRYFVENPWIFGQHSRTGLFVFSGTDFMTGNAAHDGHVMDIPATLLHLYDIPIPEDYDGRVLVDTITADYIERHPLSYQSGDDLTSSQFDDVYRDGEAQEIVERLQMLGYLD